jgi:ATP-dependent RNA helicase DDX51/DBP6
MITCDTQQKPLMLFHLVHDKDIVNALVFTKSAESTSRLVKLFEYFEDARVESGRESKRIVIRAYSSDLGASDRRVILEQFKAKEVQMLVLPHTRCLVCSPRLLERLHLSPFAV